MKATRKLIPALAMLIVAAVVMSTASYAWFTMSREVTANGMNVTVTAPNNLLIKATSADDTTYASSADITLDDANKTVIPSSSVDGLTFYGVKNNTGVNVDGSTKEETALEAVTTGYYVDFKYTVKTEGATPVDVAVKSVTLTRKGTTAKDDGLKAVRAAVIDGAGTALLTAEKPNVVLYDTTKFTTVDLAKADYFASGKAIKASKPAGTAIVDATHRGDVSFATIDATTNTGVDIFQVSNTTATPITIRVWVEGESKNCIVDNAAALNFDISIVLRDMTYVG